MKSENKNKKIFVFLILFNCFKIMPVHKSKEKKENHRFLKYFLKMGQIAK